MDVFAVWPCASPSPARCGPWLASKMPRAPLQKPLENLVFLRCRCWKSTESQCPKDADLTINAKTLLLLPNPYITL